MYERKRPFYLMSFMGLSNIQGDINDIILKFQSGKGTGEICISLCKTLNQRTVASIITEIGKNVSV